MAVPRARFAFEAHDGTIFKGDVSALMADGRHLTARLSADGERDLEGPRPHLTAAGFEVTGGPVLQVRWQPPAPPEEVPKKKEPKRQQIRDPY
jgi:hypothetical protein